MYRRIYVCIYIAVSPLCSSVMVLKNYAINKLYRYIITERRGRVVNTPASYSGGPGFNIGPETGYPDRFCVVSDRPSRQIPGQYLKLGQDRFRPQPFQFIIHLTLHCLIY
jgi:hypothetical protein